MWIQVVAICQYTRITCVCLCILVGIEFICTVKVLELENGCVFASLCLNIPFH